MKSCILRSRFYLPRQSYLSTSPAKTLFSYSSKASSTPKGTTYTKPSAGHLTKQSVRNKPLILNSTPATKTLTKDVVQLVSDDGYSRFVVLGAVSFGFAMLLAVMDDKNRALAFGPEGPLMEDFWDNMRRYGLYALTVSTGALYTIFQPIVELLKNPISAILIVVILAGSFYIVTQVVSAMVGVSDFAYEYGY
ncbi:hypothetical protein IFM89_022092 [Coptis chinensis]|uniref:Uncharacterized protein ycf33 n=1 Tax=Coptis chinensis TaxID=261450 RepID=A0A835LK64_9MAGN|nr:hypothetical protein IFM89_014594 [Coptis chinensis]KAF9597880.1 hypothetical protein IFM89_022092 [Coptis chinensis]